MNKKIFHLVAFIASVALFYYVKKSQQPPAGEVFSRTPNKLVYTNHARCRMDCRYIDESEVQEILQSGKLNFDKIEEDKRGRTYPLEGVTHDKQRVRVVFAPKQDRLVVVTVIDLDKDWACNCESAETLQEF